MDAVFGSGGAIADTHLAYSLAVPLQQAAVAQYSYQQNSLMADERHRGGRVLLVSKRWTKLPD